MNQNRFNPKVYKNKRTITVKIPYYMGIRHIYDWNEVKGQYVKRTKGNRYSATLKINGKQREKSFESIAQAKNWRESGGVEDNKIDKEFLFEDILSAYFKNVASKINPSTLKTYKNNSKHLDYFYPMPMSKITHKVIDQWLEKVKEPEYLKTCHSYKLSYEKELALLRQVFRYFTEYHNDSFASPIRGKHKKDCIINLQKYQEAKAKNQTRFMRDEEISQFLNDLKSKAEVDIAKLPYFLLALFQLRTGVRVGEAASITFNDIVWDLKPYVIINKNVQWGRGKGEETYIQHHTKTGVARKVFLPNDLQEILKSLKEAQKGLTINRLIFSQDGTTPLSYRAIQYHFDKSFKAIGSEFRSSHILRHSFSTQFLMVTKDQHSLSKILGHSNLRQTEHYAKITEGMTQDSFCQFNEHLENQHENVLEFNPKLVEAGN